MKRFLLAPLIFTLLSPVQVEANPISLEARAVELVREKEDKSLRKRIAPGKKVFYKAYTESECLYTVKAYEDMPTKITTFQWFNVDICKKKVERVCLSRFGCE